MRHCQTSLNKKHCFYGNIDVDLNEEGRKEAREMHEQYVNLTFDHLFVSQKTRTINTAQIIFPQANPIIIPNLNEFDFGAWEGLTADEIQSSYPYSWDRWMKDWQDLSPEQGENYHSFQKRILKEWKILQQKYCNKTIVIVGHLGVLRTIAQDIRKNNYWDNQFPQGKLVKIKI
ncbi:hypothetical protein BG261_09640 [Floricoccus tropicus]|uniref:Alpha-ribazole phosphatase n=1 Tax=Floricoccus tropicus TaxID=1859473 RepID=A0A1E8GQY0_9LACT|nr:histidine phosphatase family protein [Floricoccus tropicus]OFI49898.1 hypothetical protein BG261_09640 [Floricoccus tropicus]